MEESSYADVLKQNEKLEGELKIKGESLVKALERVEELQRENGSLEDMLENLQKEQLQLVETYEQDNYSLRNRVAVHEKLSAQYDANLNEESEKWKSEISQVKERLNRHHNIEVAALRQQLESVNAQLHQEKLTSTQRLDTIAKKSERIDKLTKDLRAARTSLNDTLQVEVSELSNENYNLKMIVEESAMKEHDLLQTIEQLRESVESAKFKEENWKYTKENLQAELSSSYEMLESCREEQQRLRDKLNSNLNDGIGDKGNSLFAEVDDKRINAEKNLVGLATKYKYLQKQNDQLRHHILKLKMQISGLIETRSKTTDEQLIRSLDDALSTCRDENMKLLAELKRAQERVNANEEARNSHFGESSGIAKMLESEIKMKNVELAKVSEELRISKIFSMIESRKVSDLEKQLYHKGKLLDATNSSKYRLQLEFDKFKANMAEEKKSSDLKKTPLKTETMLVKDINVCQNSPKAEKKSSDVKTAVKTETAVVKDSNVCQNSPKAELAASALSRKLSQHVENADDSHVVNSNKENEEPLSDRCKSNGSDIAQKSSCTLTTRPPLQEKTSQCHPGADPTYAANERPKATCQKNRAQCNMGVDNDTVESRKRPGFENTIETTMDDCKQQ